MGVPDVTVIVPLRDQEKRVAATIRGADEVGQYVTRPEESIPAPIGLEIVALDERSGDNTLSVLSLLHSQLSTLRTLQDLDRGTSIRRAASVARGDAWLVLDHPVDPRLAAWGINQVLRGQRAAIIPGELLAVDRALGLSVLGGLRGGLVSAQRAVARTLRKQNVPPAWSPPAEHGPVQRARLFVRGQLPRLGISWLDKPPQDGH